MFLEMKIISDGSPEVEEAHAGDGCDDEAGADDWVGVPGHELTPPAH